jgi:Putative transposase/Transposase zinc-binding domain
VPGPCLDVGAILGRAAERAGFAALTVEQRRAAEDLSACRTARLGGRVEQCCCCGAREYLYNSCRNRHCPKCQAGCRGDWLQREAGHLLPVEYHHLVFTLPAEVAELARDNPRLIYALLFEAASETVREVAADPKHLGAQVGLTAVLHTWGGQTLSLHPHLHVMATGGGLSCDRRGELDERPTWKSCRRGFFLPVRVLSALFKGKFLAGLSRARGRGELRLGGAARMLHEPAAWSSWLSGQRRLDWVVYSQPPSAGAEVVLKYLARYTYRVAISNSRLLCVSDEEVTFSYKDYRHEGRQRQMTLSLEEFARRFLQPVLPRGFVRVRHYGLLANRGREEKLRACRRLLLAEPARIRQAAGEEEQMRRCPVCGEGQMRVVETIGRQPTARPQEQDSS